MGLRGGGITTGVCSEPLMFAMVIDRLTERATRESLWTTMFADDTVICSELRERVEESQERRHGVEKR